MGYCVDGHKVAKNKNADISGAADYGDAVFAIARGEEGNRKPKNKLINF